MTARFFVDENDLALGRALEERLGHVVYPGHDNLPEVPRGTVDDAWLPVVGARKLVVITRDQRIRCRPVEKRMWVEHASLELTCRTVFIVENEITFLAFPRVCGAIVMFGSGFGITSLGPFPWLEDKEIVYWVDIDTHGFDILSRLRARFDRVQSILIDRSTLLAHRGQWVTEPSSTNRLPSNLTEAEGELYGDLIEGRFGPAIRLEQERVRFSMLQQALQPWAT